ncbi:FecR family protein [Flagellimonas pacifica]|uniref:FecR family protein n=1 Tax=Flagellimonas pacifica TaxID=1247520 RepID=A0A285MRX8_9FLAO|nr:FecR domain-containing protein [Allomuricauda parva]SNY99949.1 FecR family protein [Allomuricauda parva]
MKYANYKEEDFIKDEYFQKWVLNPDEMTANFWDNWVASNPEKREIIQNALRFIQLMDFDIHELPDEDFDAMWQNVIQRRKGVENKIYGAKRPHRLKRSYILKVAALFVGIVGMAYIIYLTGAPNNREDTTVVSEPSITLELEDGTIKILDDTSSGIITNNKGHQIVNQKQNTLLYEAESIAATENVSYNQLSVPYGKKFELILSDGSHVFLNSGSKLRYPVVFLRGKPRDVYLEGEAYFSVEKDKTRPFTVITDDMNTSVYGTEFNVSSYKNENNTSTVLVEGSVGVYKSNNAEGQQPITLTSGDRAVFKEGAIAVDQVNVSKYTAWTKGELFFVDDRFELILKELERHFNVTINNDFHQLNDKKFTGTFSKESLDQILRICQEHTPFSYMANNDSITIVNNQQ